MQEDRIDAGVGGAPAGDDIKQENDATCEKMERTDFGWALKQLRHGLNVSRIGWNGPGQYLRLQVTDEHSKMTLPYIYIRTVQRDLVPWLASQTDMLATDWKLA